MNEAQTRLQNLVDERLPALGTLLGPEAPGLLGAAVEAAGASLVSARPLQVQWQPGRALSVVYETLLEDTPRGTVRDMLVAATGDRLPAGAMLLEQGAERVAVWHLMNDPALPGLAIALDPDQLREMLPTLGVGAGEIRLRLRAYRPQRRAVVEVTAGDARLFIKVVRPKRVAALQHRHALLSAHLPTPRSHGWSPELGLVVLEAMPGATLRDVLSAREGALPAPEQIAALLDKLPAPEDGRRTPDARATVAQSADLLGRLLPDLQPSLAALSDGLAAEGGQGGPEVPVHGDLHDGQLTVLDGRITGLLDVDTAGLGHRVDDWANLAGHLATRLQAMPGHLQPRLQAYGRQIAALADGQAHPATFRRRVAAVVLALATGPFRVQSADWPEETRMRVALAAAWLESAQRTYHTYRVGQPHTQTEGVQIT